MFYYDIEKPHKSSSLKNQCACLIKWSYLAPQIMLYIAANISLRPFSDTAFIYGQTIDIHIENRPKVNVGKKIYKSNVSCVEKCRFFIKWASVRDKMFLTEFIGIPFSMSSLSQVVNGSQWICSTEYVYLSRLFFLLLF